MTEIETRLTTKASLELEKQIKEELQKEDPSVAMILSLINGDCNGEETKSNKEGGKVQSTGEGD